MYEYRFPEDGYYILCRYNRHTYTVFNRRMPKCNTVLQSENDLFQPKIQPNSHGNCEFLALIRTIKSSKCFGHCPVKTYYTSGQNLQLDKPFYYSIISHTQSYCVMAVPEP